jgi:hypothetical protein
MLPNVSRQHRIKQFDRLLAHELSCLQREHVQNLATHQKLEDSIRHGTPKRLASRSRMRGKSMDSVISERISINPSKRLSAFDGSSINRQSRFNPNDQDTRSRDSITIHPQPIIDPYERHRRALSKSPHTFSSTKLHSRSVEHKPLSWLPAALHERSSRNKDRTTWIFIDDDQANDDVVSPSVIDKQIRLFLDRLPKYKGHQEGFDSFAAGSSYSFRKAISIPSIRKVIVV